jgi:hypothetical protein
VPEEERTAAETADDSAATRDDRGGAAPASPDGSVTGPPGTEAPVTGPPGTGAQAAAAPGRSRQWRVTGAVGLWLSIFAGSMGLFTVRFLVPVPVGTANNGDGARLMCAFGVAPVTGGHLSEFKYAYFQFNRAPSACAHAHLYPSSQHLLLAVAQWLTPVLGLPGRINLIALGLLTSAIASFAIASLATGLRVNIWARLAVAAGIWLVMADGAFFELFASPLSEGSTLVGLVLVAAGVVYLGRSWPAAVFGLLLAGTGSYLVLLSKEQYLPLAVPIFLTLVLASTVRGSGPRLRRLLTQRTAAAAAVIAVLAVLGGSYVLWDHGSKYAAVLHHEQAVDMTFAGIVTGHDNVHADLRALGLPASWAKYAGTDYWSPVTVRHDPLYTRYARKLSDRNIAHFLLTHPSRIIGVGQLEAKQALHVRVGYLGTYAPSAGHPPGAVETRVDVVSWLIRAIGPRLGLLFLVPLWAVMAVIAIVSLRRRYSGSWRRDGAVLVLCMTGCAIAAFIPPGYFEGTAVPRHMLGMNLATALAVPVSLALAIAMIGDGVTRLRRHPEPSAPAEAKAPVAA